MELCIKGFESEDVKEKLKAMRMCGINIGKVIECAILNFDVEDYLKECVQADKV